MAMINDTKIVNDRSFVINHSSLKAILHYYDKNEQLFIVLLDRKRTE